MRESQREGVTLLGGVQGQGAKFSFRKKKPKKESSQPQPVPAPVGVDQDTQTTPLLNDPNKSIEVLLPKTNKKVGTYDNPFGTQDDGSSPGTGTSKKSK